MEKLIVTIDTKDNARMVAKMLRQLSFVNNVQLEDGPDQKSSLPNSSFLYPGNPMNEDDVKQMISECESEPYFNSEEARNLSLKIIKKWENQKK